MSLIVEDGTGLSDAEAYQSVAGLREYADKRGLELGTDEDVDLERALRVGAEFIDTLHRYLGGRMRASQGLEFPRTGLSDWSGHVVTGVPAKVVKANSEAALRALEGPLYEDLDRGGQVVSESVGPMSTTYAEGAPVGTVYRAVEKLLEEFVHTSTARMSGPRFETPHPSQFSVGMHDFSGGE